ncbi:MAG TPA: RES domain-containing protein [Candidatus Eremiobacteraceae bacterium]|nr:RES domain-containing protein [Candidatus Eremiobacteraceae bacterium]
MPVKLYRVFSFREASAPDEPGGALYIPPQGRGRIDNPRHYAVFYAARQPEAAVTEVLGPREPGPLSVGSLRGSPLLIGSVLALATLQIPSLERLCDLDEPQELVARTMRPSTVVSADHGVSQRWALTIYQERRVPSWIGVSWWSRYESSWTSVGVWKRTILKLVDVELLTIEHPAVREAARILRRPIIRPARIMRSPRQRGPR